MRYIGFIILGIGMVLMLLTDTTIGMLVLGVGALVIGFQTKDSRFNRYGYISCGVFIIGYIAYVYTKIYLLG